MRNLSKPMHIGGTDILINGEQCHLDPRGIMYLPAHRVLVVSDLHLEKGSSFARRGMMLPPYDTLTTLALLAQAVETYQPLCIISLGDSFHDRQGALRLPHQAHELLKQMMFKRQWLWIEGNHDPFKPANLEGEGLAQFELGQLIFRHEPQNTITAGEIAGHLHPGARVVRQGRSLRRSCFASDGRRLIMPAFGAYTGSLNVLDQAFNGLFSPAEFIAYLRGDTRVFTIHQRFLRSD